MKGVSTDADSQTSHVTSICIKQYDFDGDTQILCNASLHWTDTKIIIQKLLTENISLEWEALENSQAIGFVWWSLQAAPISWDDDAFQSTRGRLALSYDYMIRSEIHPKSELLFVGCTYLLAHNTSRPCPYHSTSPNRQFKQQHMCFYSLPPPFLARPPPRLAASVEMLKEAPLKHDRHMCDTGKLCWILIKHVTAVSLQQSLSQPAIYIHARFIMIHQLVTCHLWSLVIDLITTCESCESRHTATQLI